MGLGGVAIAVPPYVIHPKTAVLGRAGGGDEKTEFEMRKRDWKSRKRIVLE